MEYQAADVDRLIGYRLKQTQAVLRARMDEALRPLGLTTPQYSCLEVLRSMPGASNSDVARRVFVTRQTMNTLLRSLQRRGLIERAGQAATGRALPVVLTDAGQALLEDASARVGVFESAMTQALDSTQRAALVGALRTCVAALEAVPRHAPS